MSVQPTVQFATPVQPFVQRQLTVFGCGQIGVQTNVGCVVVVIVRCCCAAKLQPAVQRTSLHSACACCAPAKVQPVV